ncbi:MAG TPA: hypothetical protein VMT60_03570 [Candidatus Bathyarchaeia archaeon]|nr:hypothetical protein [Candidatus Bathyarchaeia archaeon]
MQPQRNKVVVHYADGKLVKGYTHDFLPERESFHLNTAIEPGTGTVHEVEIAELKAVFFVKSFEGNMTYREKSTFEDADAKALHGIKIKVTFKDGEILRGISLGYSKAKRGFFVVPIDPQSNNERIFVVATATTEVVVGPDAEK